MKWSEKCIASTKYSLSPYKDVVLTLANAYSCVTFSRVNNRNLTNGKIVDSCRLRRWFSRSVLNRQVLEDFCYSAQEPIALNSIAI